MKKNDTVALVMAPGVRWAPYDNDSFDIWIINGGFRSAERFDLLFDMHDWVDSDYTPKYYEELKEKDFPIVKPAHDPNIKKEILYPQDLMTLFPYQMKHSSCYMLAYAWWKSYKNVYIYGLTGGEFERHPYMGYALYFIYGFIHGVVNVYFVGKMAMDNSTLYGMGLEWRKSDMMYEGAANFDFKRWDNMEKMNEGD